LVLLIGVFLGLNFAERNAAHFGSKPNHLYNLVVVVLITGMIGARLVYVLRYPSAFLESPLSLVSPNPSLLDLWGGIGAGLIAFYVYTQRKGLHLWSTLDALTPLLAVMFIAMPLTNLASGKAFGTITHLPWGIDLWGGTRHPTQIYEALAAFFILYLLWPGRERFSAPVNGSYFLTFLTLSAGARLFLEAFRGDSALLPGRVRTAQLVAWIVMAVSLWGKNRLNTNTETHRLYHPKDVYSVSRWGCSRQS
jgi:phosphatidylglycerol:prolipoprotein diacylglycerol transferase